MASPWIAVDAFGGDEHPRVEVEAAVAAAREGVNVILVGDRAILEPALEAYAGEALPLKVHHAPDAIGMDESPSRAVRRKPEASMPVCFDLVKRGEADAVVSAGNSGAMLACGLFKFGRIKGVERPAIATVLPTKGESPVCLLDMGANIDCRPLHLAQFAVMGAVFAKVDLGSAKPCVGVLCNGSEASKGTELTRAVDQALREHRSADFEYAGYVEGKDVFSGKVQVVVTDGFTGNITLKIIEGTTSLVASFLSQSLRDSAWSKIGARLMRSSLYRLKERMDPDTYGGAPLLGVNGVAVICHGGASPVAFANGIRLASDFVEQGLTPGLSQAIDAHSHLFSAFRSEG